MLKMGAGNGSLLLPSIDFSSRSGPLFIKTTWNFSQQDR